MGAHCWTSQQWHPCGFAPPEIARVSYNCRYLLGVLPRKRGVRHGQGRDRREARHVGVIPSGFRAKCLSLARFTTSGKLAHWAAVLPRIAEWEPELLKLNDHELRKRSLALRYRARSGEPLGRLLPEAYALVREAGRRTINMRHFDVQLLGGTAMFHRSIVEMQTGRRQDAHRHAADVSVCPGRQGRPVGHGQRLPRPPRCRVDAADLRGPRAVGRSDSDAAGAAAAAQGLTPAT